MHPNLFPEKPRPPDHELQMFLQNLSAAELLELAGMLECWAAQLRAAKGNQGNASNN